jgi:hypothetical protein
MRRLSAVLLAGAILMLPAFSTSAQAQDAQPAAQPAAQEQSSPLGPALNYTGAVVIAAYVVAPDKVADYEKVLATLKDALMKSTKPEARQQMAGWRIIRNEATQPNGDVLFIHVINNVPNADYSITNIVYEANPDPAARTAFYELYRGALKQALFVIQGPVVANLAQ